MAETTEGQTSFFQIPGNVKQSMLPFVLNPKSPLNDVRETSESFKGTGVSPQIFSYRNVYGNAYTSGKAQLNFYPSSMKDIHFEDDITWKLLYARDRRFTTTTKSIGINDILNNIPGIQIREFLPDTRLDQCINLFKSLFDGIKSIGSDDTTSTSTSKTENVSADQKGNSNENTISEFGKKLFAVVTYTMKYMVGASKPNNFFTDLQSVDKEKVRFTSYKQSEWSTPGTQSYYIMTFPYRLYYRLQSCLTTNIYEIPGTDSNKALIDSSSGMAGWTDGGGDFNSGFRMSGVLAQIPGIGGILDMLLGNIGINYMPWWSAKAGTEGSKAPEIEIKFDLFNDSAEAAKMNFIFVNTIVPGNKWVQYNMFQHSPNLYDVKIEGINRLYACAGAFNVTYDGQLRNPPYRWIAELVSKHGNKCINKTQFIENIVNNRLIKIPDIYHVVMKFQSLLPANFNNYLYTYAENTNHISTYARNVYDQSTISDALEKVLPTYIKRVTNVWKAGDESVENAEAKKTK